MTSRHAHEFHTTKLASPDQLNLKKQRWTSQACNGSLLLENVAATWKVGANSSRGMWPKFVDVFASLFLHSLSGDSIREIVSKFVDVFASLFRYPQFERGQHW